MIPMKYLHIPLAIALLASTVAVHAQAKAKASPQKAPPQWISVTDSIGREIGMSDDQIFQWKIHNDEWEAKFKGLGGKAELKPTYIKLHSARELDLKGFLTAGQYDKWKELNRRSLRLERENPPGTNMPPTR